MPETNNIIDFKLRNIGPFQEEFRFRHDAGNKSLKIAIYATNGSGKTFISRCFHLIDASNVGEEEYYPYSALVSLGKDSGSFNITRTTTGQTSTYEAQITNNSKNITNNRNEVIYHVFNSDYIKRQFMERDYVPNGNIKGKIVVGEENTKTAKLKEELQEKQNENISIKNELSQIIETEKKRLKEQYDIRNNLQTGQYINFDNIISDKQLESNDTLSGLETSYANLKRFGKVADNYTDIPKLSELSNIQVNTDELKNILDQKYERGFIEKTFLEKIKGSQDFIKRGLELTKGDVCPYCGQSLNNVKEVIAAYNNFFDTTQTSVSQRLDIYKNILVHFQKDVETLVENSVRYVKQFNELKQYFPSTENLLLNPIVEPASLQDLISACLQIIDTKAKDITQRSKDLSKEQVLLAQAIKDINGQIVDFNKTIASVNSAKSKTLEELRIIKNRICMYAFNNLITKNSSHISKYNSNLDRITVIENELQKNASTQSKKDLVYETFCELIKTYFGDKYTVEKDTFSLKLNSVDIEKPSIVLSDGEKSIVAFCYYLANVHTKMTKKADYDNLFLIIDDPISSMDFAYVYETAQIIRCLPEIVKNNRISFMIFTHNSEFINILEANDLVTATYTFGRGNSEIKKLKGGLVFPYQEHLKDIFRIATDEIKPCHTTYNSIRHILEGIKYFMEPDNNSLDDFVAKQEVKSHKLFENNGHMKRVIQDMSHGRIRTESDDIYEDKTIEGCKELIEYMREHFPGQIEHIKNRNAQS